MAEKDDTRKKKIAQDLLLDDFFKPPAEEESQELEIKIPVPSSKETPLKKDLLLDDFFKPPAEEIPVKEKAPPAQKREAPSPAAEQKGETVSSQVKAQRQETRPPAPEPPAKPEPPPMPPPPSKSLKELLEQPLFEEKREEKPYYTPPPDKIPTPAPQYTPIPAQPVGVRERRKFLGVPLMAGAVLILLAAGAFFIFSTKGKQAQVAEVKPPKEGFTVTIPPPPVPRVEEPRPQEDVRPSVEPAPPPAPEKPPEKVAPPSPPVAKVARFFVEAGPYSTRDEAKAGEIKAKIFGFVPEITSRTKSEEMYNLFVENVMPPEEAKVAELKLKINGFSPELIDEGENQKVKVGSYSRLTDAIEKKNSASELGYNIVIDIKKSTETLYYLKMSFPEADSAKNAVEKLKGIGIEAQLSSMGG